MKIKDNYTKFEENLADFSKNFVPIFQKTPILIKISSIFVEQNGLSALFPTVVIDESHQLIKDLFEVGDDYDVMYLGGGASQNQLQNAANNDFILLNCGNFRIINK